MKIGTRSVLFGTHQFLWHPVTVGLAWHRLYGVWPTWREWVCIFVHDLGYWGKPNIDGPEGRRHPEAGARLAWRLLDDPARNTHPFTDLTLFHSREYAKLRGGEPSLLCWADKFSIWYDPAWFYLLRARLSGEIHEFKRNAPEHVRAESDRFWFNWLRTKFRNINEIRTLLDA